MTDPEQICVIHKRETYSSPLGDDRLVERELIVQGVGIDKLVRIMRGEWKDWDCQEKRKGPVRRKQFKG